MKTLLAVVLASALVWQNNAFPTTVERRAPQTCGFPAVTLLRAFKKSNGDHFYTTDVEEMIKAVGNLGYKSEGDAALVFSSGDPPGSVPLFRLFRKSNGDHFYTTNATERDVAVQQLKYADEGIAAFIYPNSMCESVPLFRVFKPGSGDHFYTTDETEKESAITALNYVDEGIAGFVNPQ